MNPQPPKNAKVRTELAVQLATARGPANTHSDDLLAELFGLDTADSETPDLEKLGLEKRARPGLISCAVDLVCGLASEFGRLTGVCLVRISSGLVVGFHVSGNPATERIVVKVHRNHVAARLDAVVRAQSALVAAGIPVASLLTDAPRALGTGHALVETWRADGDTVDVRSTDRRRALARGSFTISESLDANQFGDLAPDWSGRFAPPHSPMFNFEATGTGAGWIDRLADMALEGANRLTADGVGERRVVHTDLRPENVLLDLARSAPVVSTIYDLDSLQLGSEAWLIGGVARAYSTNWSLPDPMIPGVSEIRAFVKDYEFVRGQLFSPEEMRLAELGTLHALAYSARCEHALYPDGSVAPWGPGWRSLLQQFATGLGVRVDQG